MYCFIFSLTWTWAHCDLKGDNHQLAGYLYSIRNSSNWKQDWLSRSAIIHSQKTRKTSTYCGSSSPVATLLHSNIRLFRDLFHTSCSEVSEVNNLHFSYMPGFKKVTRCHWNGNFFAVPALYHSMNYLCERCLLGFRINPSWIVNDFAGYTIEEMTSSPLLLP